MAGKHEDTNTQRGRRGAWRAVVPLVAAALTALAPAVVLGGRVIQEWRERSSRTPRFDLVPLLGGLLALVGAILWRNRDRAGEVVGDAVATAEDLAGRLASAASPDEPTLMGGPLDTYGAPARQGVPAA